MANAQSSHYFSFSNRGSSWRKRVWSPVQVSLVAFFLLLISLSFISFSAPSYAVLPSFITPVSAAPLRPSYFAEPVQLAAACDVCNHMIMNLVNQLAHAIELQNRTVATARDTEAFMDHLCDPDNVAGIWLRRIGFFVVPEDSKNPKSPVRFEQRVLKDYAKCKRACVTARDICHTLIDMPAFDELTTRIPALSMQSPLLLDENAVNILRAMVCYKFEVCAKKRDYLETLNNILNNPKATLRNEIERDEMEFITPELLDRELTAYATQRSYNVDAFSREEIRALHDALELGDRAKAAAIDEKINSLTTDEFFQLRRLAMQQRKEMENEAARKQAEERMKEAEIYQKKETEKREKKEAERKAKREARRARRMQRKQAKENSDL